MNLKKIADECKNISIAMRKQMLSMSKIAVDEIHWGGCFSTVEIAAVLFNNILNCKNCENNFKTKDKFILSKGHAGLAIYTAMYNVGLIAEETLMTYQKDGSHISELMVSDEKLGFEMSGGSLGLGPSYAVGLAQLAKVKNYNYRTFVEVGDGELDEGSVWEAVMLAGQLKLSNLCLIVDANTLQSDGFTKDIISWENILLNFESFGWYAVAVDGHDCEALLNAFYDGFNHGKPFALIANTIKGKGVSFFENNYIYHDKVLTKTELSKAASELGVEL
ncbi:MAG: thiamine pyrophosphate-dependent enzyme [Oscillospiraceae bacterium]